MRSLVLGSPAGTPAGDTWVSYRAYYFEAAPVNQGTSISWSSTNVNVTGTGQAIGTGRASTAIIIATHSSDTIANNAAKAAAEYTGGGKTDWFLPSLRELNEMYEARIHLILSSGEFWSSTDSGTSSAWVQSFISGAQNYIGKNNNRSVRAIRAF